MKCWNCLKHISDSAKVCPHCESPARPGDPELEQAAAEVLDKMDPEALAELRQAAEHSPTADEFIRQVFIGNCPRCGSNKTGDGENDPEIDNLLVARCLDCGHYWCAECGRVLDKKAPDCPCWAEDEFEDADEDEDEDEDEGKA